VRWLYVALAAGCDAPAIAVAPSDASAEAETVAVTDTRVCPTLFAADGKECTGPDEDDDCIRDTCDDCPLVWQPATVERAAPGITTVGNACTQPDARAVTKRVLFDPFERLATTVWEAPSPYDVNDRARMEDGFLRMGANGQPFIRSKLALGARPVVASAVMRLTRGWFAGVYVRMTNEGPFAVARGYGCAVDTNAVWAFYTAAACPVNGTCNRVALKDSSGRELRAPLTFSPDRWFLVRATVAAGVFQCQAYRFDSGAEKVLRLATPNEYTLTATLDETVPKIEGGEVGVFTAGSTVEIAAVDVLSD
jgi:hypothetical protein